MHIIEQNIRITGSGKELQGVGRAPDGRALFVDGALPDELCDVAITKQQERCLFGKIHRLVEQSPLRITPDCPYYGLCGGCAALHMDYALALRLKAQKVRDALVRIGKIDDPPLLAPIPAPQTFRYRNKAEYAAANGAFGAMAKASRDIVDLGDCLLQSPQSTAFLNAVRQSMRANRDLCGVVTRTNHQGQLMAILCFHHGRKVQYDPALVDRVHSLYACALSPRPHHALDGKITHLGGAPALPERLAGIDFALSPLSFFQVNRDQAENLVAELLRALELRGDERVFDLYCGIGTLTLPLAKAAKSATGIEIVAPAIEDAIAAAQSNGIKNARFQCGDAGKLLADALKSGAKPHVIVVDPPRKGLDPGLIPHILSARPEKIGYVSCDCATLARDLRLILDSGAYRLTSATPVDMFPHTEHIETVCVLERAEK